MTVTTALQALLLFELKHFLCDFVLQTKWQVDAKKRYGAAGGVLHAGLHGLTSLPALLVLTATPALLIAIPLFEFALHYHIDWAKARIDTTAGWTVADQAYWMIFGLDQLLHQLTYLGFVAAFAYAF